MKLKFAMLVTLLLCLALNRHIHEVKKTKAKQKKTQKSVAVKPQFFVPFPKITYVF